MNQKAYMPRNMAVTLLELLIVVLIVGLLATVATGIYTDEADRARVAATKALINNLEIQITRYNVDTGLLPPSGSGTIFPAVEPFDASQNQTRRDGSGYLHQALMHSNSGSSSAPSPTTWRGPYINLQADQLAHTSEGVNLQPGESDILDAWGSPLIYIKSDDYAILAGDFAGATHLFSATAPAGANPNLPAPNPSVTYGETYYNPQSYQIISFGKNRLSFGIVNGVNYNGAEADDVTNFGF